MFIHHDYHENLDPYDPFRPPCLPSHMFTFHLYSYSHSMYPRSPPQKKTPSSCHSSPPSWCHKKVWRRIFGHHTSNPISFFATLAHLVSSMTTSRLSAPPKFLQEMMRSGSGCQCWAVDWWGIILFFWVDMCLFLHLPHPFAELSQFKRLLLSFVAPSTVSPRKQGNYIKNILAVTEHDGIQFKLNRNNGCRKFSTVNMLWTWHFTNKSIYRSIFFSRMRGKGSRFTLGVWGLRVCSLDVAFASATVRNRPYELRMAVPMGSFAEVVLFGGFRHLVASFRVAGVALRDIQTCSATCRKSFRVAGAILLRRFQKMCCSFRGRRSTLDVSIVIFRGRRSTLDVSCCVFFVNRIGGAASSGDKVQIPWQAWHFLTCAENWRKPRTKHRFWCWQFSGSKENS